MLTYRPTVGQVALIEPVKADPTGEIGMTSLTGVVQGETDRTLTMVGLSSRDLIDDTEVVVNVFAPEALFRIRGRVHWSDEGRLLVDPIEDVERVQRRRWPRHPVQLDVTLASLDEPGDDVGGVAGRTIDLGMGGLRVETIRRLTPGADLTVMFTLPDRTSVVARTTVVSTMFSKHGYEYGLAFDRLDDADAAHLMALVGAKVTGSPPR